MKKTFTRREMLRVSIAAATAASVFPIGGCATGQSRKKAKGPATYPGIILGEENGAFIGNAILANGGNVIDGLVAAALGCCAATPSRCGLAGYGGHLIFYNAKLKRVECVDFNTMAPAAALPTLYQIDGNGKVVDRKNFYGWLAAGVPGTLWGLQFALKQHGTMKLSDVIQPAIKIATDGFVVTPMFAKAVQSALPRFEKDPGSARVYLKDGKPPHAGDLLKNPELAEVMSTLAQRNSAESFYRGDIAHTIVDTFRKNGGIVTARDYAIYHPIVGRPYQINCGGCDVYTAPLTAGGLTTLEALSILKHLNFENAEQGPQATHMRVEALRLAWKDRLEKFGDPRFTDDLQPQQFLAEDHIKELADLVEASVKSERPILIKLPKHTDDGTVNLSGADKDGNVAAITLTQGGGFGAQITVSGMTFGHGMSRFNPLPGHPNSVAPRKRPLDNMCPTVLVSEDRVMAIGGSGGVRIPNTIHDVLLNFLFRKQNVQDSIAAPRMHTTGTLDVGLEQHWPKAEREYLKKLGFNMQTIEGAIASAACYNRKTNTYAGALR